MRDFIAAVAVCALLSTPAAAAQTRSRRTTTTQRRGTPSRTATQSRLDQTKVNAVRLQLSELNKDLTRFLYLYGRISKDLELTSAQAESAEVAGRTRAGLLENVRAMRDRLDQLEGQFRFTPGLERQYRSLQGVSRRADEAAQLVAGGRFDQAGKVLVEVAAQLTDVLVEM
ncbi:MAG TPA: hypothetical protein VD968_07715 [Pyrinomonadaceae bacterium]|nr:hypothetical protein [Pyrinomonadaceae bacterium]